jgi:hypothetical protein
MPARYRPRLDSLEERCLLSVFIREYNLPQQGTDVALAIAAGPDGNLWFTEDKKKGTQLLCRKP